MDIVNGPFTTPRNSPFPYQTDDHPLFATPNRHDYNAVVSNLRQQYQEQLNQLKAANTANPGTELDTSALTTFFNDQMTAINQEWNATVTRTTNPAIKH